TKAADRDVIDMHIGENDAGSEVAVENNAIRTVPGSSFGSPPPSELEVGDVEAGGVKNFDSVSPTGVNRRGSRHWVRGIVGIVGTYGNGRIGSAHVRQLIGRLQREIACKCLPALEENLI